jgi:serine/threonine-protein kinase
MTGGLGDQAALRRFTREAHASARLAHPNIVRLYDYGPLAGDSAYLVLEFVPGVSWRSELRRVGAFSTALAAGRLDQLLDGIASAHASGVLHRDLKPENLLIHAASEDSAGVVKILDFGLAKVREPSFLDPKSRTSSGIAMGTFGYMSPEQFGGEEVDERTDVYAIGVIALESLTGSIPFERQTFHRAIDRVLEERLIRAAATDAQRELARVLESALAPARRNRFASAAEFRAALVPALRSCPEAPVVVRAATSAPGTPASSTATTVNVRKPPAGP